MVSTPAFPISDVTKKVFANFCKLSEQVLLQPGSTQKIAGPNKSRSMIAIAMLPEPWPKETAIYNFPKFMSVLSQFDKPAIQFNLDSIIVANDARTSELKVRLRLGDPSTIEQMPEKDFPIDNPAVELMLSKFALGRLTKMASLLDLEHFSLVVDPEHVFVQAADAKNPLSDTFEIAVTDVVRREPAFARSMRFSVANFDRLLDGDYKL